MNLAIGSLWTVPTVFKTVDGPREERAVPKSVDGPPEERAVPKSVDGL